MAQPAVIDLRLLGDLELVRDGEPVPLPPSRKTRALLAYLVASARPHRRERLCELFWDVADDPRAALRWSLSKLRPLVDEPDRRRIVADRSTVAFDADGVRIDLFEVREELRGLEHAASATRPVSAGDRDDGLPSAPVDGRPSTRRLEQLATLFRGEFLEGLELPDYQEFQAWCMAEREAARTLRTRLLATLVERLSAEPADAIPHARRLALVDPYDTAGHVTLLSLELARGHRKDAERHLEIAGRLLAELGPEPPRELRRIWRELLAASERAVAVTPSTGSAATPAASLDDGQVEGEVEGQVEGDPLPATILAEDPGASADVGRRIAPLVGRRSERGRLLTALDMTSMRRRAHVALLEGEPGIGKSRLLAELIAEARRRGGTILHGIAYEAESGRPYGPWIDALRGVHPTQVGSTLGAELALLLPELSLRDGRDGDAGREPDGDRVAPGAPAVDAPDDRERRWAHAADDQRHGRDRLFGAVSELVAARAHSTPPVVIVLDDVQWCDVASAELLHYVIRMSRHRPLLVALAARSGELNDNEPMRRVIRGLRRDRSLEELKIGPLTSDETASLLESIAPGIDPARILEQTAGNPLFAIEVARALPLAGAARHDGDHEAGGDAIEEVPQSVGQIVRDRIERLPPGAGDTLRWASVLGCTFSEQQLGDLAPVDLDDLVAALEILERHGLILPATGHGRQASRGAYAFAHDVLRHAVYADISEPRRRLMHRRAAELLGVGTDGLAAPERASEVARHAALAGDVHLAARACVAAGEHCLRLFASVEAHTLARRGLQHAAELDESERVKLSLELLRVSFAARRPESLDDAATMIETLAERALDLGCIEHARLGFHIVSHLRWEGGDWSEAKRQTLRAELVSRSADDRERVVAMAEAARCLAMLERDLGHAEALALEAGALSSRVGVEPSAVPAAMGMLRLHQGQLEQSAEHFRHARMLARRDGDRHGEFTALEHLVMIELECEDPGEAERLTAELVTLGAKLRDGSEAPFAHVLVALAHLARGDPGAPGRFDAELEALRQADAKHRLAWALTRAAELELARGQADHARHWAGEALGAAEALGRPSEIVLARAALAGAAEALGDQDTRAACLAALDTRATHAPHHLSARARLVIERLTGNPETRRDGTRTGAPATQRRPRGTRRSMEVTE